MTIIYNAADSTIANRLQQDLGSTENATIVILSPEAVADSAVQAAIIEAIDHNRRIVPVLARTTDSPTLIEHLTPVDFTRNYDVGALTTRLSSLANELHLKVRTPAVQQSNRRAAYVVAAIAVLMFVGGLYLVGVLGIQAPAEEYNYVETEIIMTRNFYVDSVLPRSTEDANNFQATVDAARPTLRPILIATATAVAEQNPAD